MQSSEFAVLHEGFVATETETASQLRCRALYARRWRVAQTVRAWNSVTNYIMCGAAYSLSFFALSSLDVMMVWY
jgi:hypothetical protein